MAGASDGERSGEAAIAAQWLEDARRFIAETFPDWEREGRVVPPLGDDRSVEASLVSLFAESGRKSGAARFVVYASDARRLLGARKRGGIHERLGDIEGDHDVVIVDGRQGVFLVRVCGIGEGKRTVRLLREKRDGAAKDLDQLKTSMQEAGMEKDQLDKCLLFRLPIVAFPRLRKKEKQLEGDPVLYEGDYQSPEAFEQWWEENVSRRLDAKEMQLRPDEHQTLLAM